MKITIEPTEDQSHMGNADCLHSKVSIEISSDKLDIRDTMEQVVKSLKAWGFHDESIADYLDEEFAWSLGLNKEELYYTRKGVSSVPVKECELKDETYESGGV